jgi:hypothetical protein
LAPHPGLVTWAAARPGPAPLAGHLQTLRAGSATGLAVVVAPVGVAQTRAAVAELSDSAAFAAAAAGGVTVLVDCGRLDPAAVPVADLLVVLAAPTPVELARLAGSADLLAGAGREVGVLLAGQPAWPVEQVAEAVGLRVLGVVPDDPRGAEALAHPAGRPGRSRARRSPLLEAGSDVAEVLAGRLALTAPVQALPWPRPASAVRLAAAPRQRLGEAVTSQRGRPPRGALRPEAIPSAPAVLPTTSDPLDGLAAGSRSSGGRPRRETRSPRPATGAARPGVPRPAVDGWVPTIPPDDPVPPHAPDRHGPAVPGRPS